jgi:hypothetical protein
MQKEKLKRIERQVGADMEPEDRELHFVFGTSGEIQKQKKKLEAKNPEALKFIFEVELVDTKEEQPKTGSNDPVSIESLSDEELEKEIAKAEKEIAVDR